MTETQTIYRCTPRQVRQYIIEIFEAGLVPNVISSPGMGKSSIYRQVCDYLNLQMIDHRISTSETTDFTGLPRITPEGYALYAPFREIFPLEGTPLPKDLKGRLMEGWCIFFDEHNAAPKQIQAASYKVVLDKMIGQHKLHPRVVLSMAGNLATDRAIVNLAGTAMQSRVITLEMIVSFEEWLMDVALPQNYDPRILAYLQAHQGDLMDFRPDHNDKTFCCPRTWEFMNRLIHDKPITSTRMPMYAGTITSAVAGKFVAFTQVKDELVSFEDIMRDPMGCPVPRNNDVRWVTVSSMLEKVNADTFTPLSDYVNRFTMDFRILFFRSAMVKHKSALRHHPAFGKGMVELSRYLNDRESASL